MEQAVKDQNEYVIICEQRGKLRAAATPANFFKSTPPLVIWPVSTSANRVIYFCPHAGCVRARGCDKITTPYTAPVRGQPLREPAMQRRTV